MSRAPNPHPRRWAKRLWFSAFITGLAMILGFMSAPAQAATATPAAVSINGLRATPIASGVCDTQFGHLRSVAARLSYLLFDDASGHRWIYLQVQNAHNIMNRPVKIVAIDVVANGPYPAIVPFDHLIRARLKPAAATGGITVSAQRANGYKQVIKLPGVKELMATPTYGPYIACIPRAV